jgi:hypothetical protein
MQSIAEKKLEPRLNGFFGFTGCELVSVNALVCAGSSGERLGRRKGIY